MGLADPYVLSPLIPRALLDVTGGVDDDGPRGDKRVTNPPPLTPLKVKSCAVVHHDGVHLLRCINHVGAALDDGALYDQAWQVWPACCQDR
jgi:hypothetical protein